MSKPRISNERLAAIKSQLDYANVRGVPGKLSEKSSLALDLIDARRDPAAAEQRCRELEADAERYRAIRTEGWWISQYDVMVNVFTTGEQGENIGVGETLDTAIDAAIAAQRQKEGE